MKRKLLVICGSTVTGKTNLGLRLAKKLEGEVISADSRQVYKGMDIGTGKDLPRNFGFRTSDLRFKGAKVGYYTDGDTRIWGYDLVSPKGSFSVAEYIRIAGKVIENIWKRGKLPILVGGTGLYIQGVVDGIPTATIPRNERLRSSLEGKGFPELFEMLAQLDPVKAASLNTSDRKNPRRLIRSIEIADAVMRGKDKSSKKMAVDDVLFIGLVAPRGKLNERIDKRVGSRLREGFEKEVSRLLKEGVSWEMQSMSSLGYRQWRDYVEGKLTKDQAIEKWRSEERKYAKRQITWFKKDKRINWFNISKSNWQRSVEKMVEKWYISSSIANA